LYLYNKLSQREKSALHIYYYSALLFAAFRLQKLTKPLTRSPTEVNPLEMHALLVGRDTLLVFSTHFIPLLCVFYTLFTQPILLQLKQISKGL